MTNNLLTRIKRIINVTNKDDILNDFIEMYEQAICLKVNADKLPVQLEWILIEAVIARYNKLGSEGMKSEKIDVVTMQFHDELLDQYDSYFEEYKRQNSDTNTSGQPRLRLF